jgi:hypothetical protein
MRKVLLVAYPSSEACIPAWDDRFQGPKGFPKTSWRPRGAVTGFQFVGAFAESGNLPQTFPASATCAARDVVISAEFGAFGNSFRLPRGKFNLVAMPHDLQVADTEFSSLQLEGEILQSKTLRNINLLPLRSAIQGIAPETVTNVWVNPLVAVVDLDTEIDHDLLGFLMGEQSALRVEPISNPEESLRDLILDELTNRLRTAERESPRRARSLVERLIWGSQRGSYRHRDFAGLDRWRGRFSITGYGSGLPRIDWSCSARLSPAAVKMTKHWRQQLLLEAAAHSLELRIHRPETAPEFAGEAQQLPSSYDPGEAFQVALAHNPVGSFLREQLHRCPPAECPPLVASWRNFSQHKWTMHDFVENLLQQVFIRSEIVVAWPGYRSRVGDNPSPRDSVRQAHYAARFQGGWVDLIRSRVPGRTGALRNLLQNLAPTSYSRAEQAVWKLPYPGEWWTAWLEAVFQAAVSVHLVFPLPGEGPFYLGESQLGDRLGEEPDTVEHSDTPNWPKVIF